MTRRQIPLLARIHPEVEYRSIAQFRAKQLCVKHTDDQWYTLSEICQMYNMPVSTLIGRLKKPKKWSVQRALTTPVDEKKQANGLKKGTRSQGLRHGK